MKTGTLNEKSCFIFRNKFIKNSFESNINYNQIFRNDLEVLFLRPTNLSTFLNFFNEGYKYCLKRKYDKAVEAFQTALLFKNDDFSTTKFLKKLYRRNSRKRTTKRVRMRII